MNDRELQQLLDETAARLGVVGAQLAIYDGREQLELAAGHRDRDLQLPVTADTLFQIGSTSKLFNAALGMSLVDAGRLDLDTPVHEYILNFQLSDAEAQASITLRHLLSMSGGLDNGTYHDYGRGDDALGRYVDGLEGIPHLFAPGTAFGYSNASTIVAGHAAACVAGRTWERLLRERIWEPLGLEHSALLAEEILLHPMALGYRRADTAAQRIGSWPQNRSMGPAGGLTCCSAGDLLRLGRMFLEGGKSRDGVQVLSADAVEMMHTPQIKLPTLHFADEWCVGPYRKRWDGHLIYGHSGTNRGGSSTLLWCPDENIVIATAVNVAEQGYALADAIFDEVFPKLFSITKPPALNSEDCKAVALDLSPYVGRFEAFGMTLRFTIEDGKLIANGNSMSRVVTNCELIPLGEDRFLPCDLEISGHRNWDIAFWGRDDHGRATHLLNGVFPLRRTG